MDRVVDTVFQEITRIYEGVEAPEKTEPLLISAERIKHGEEME